MGIYLLATNGEGVRIGAAMIGLTILPICGFPFALVLAVFPGTLIGALVGLVSALLLTGLKRANPGAGALVGLIAGALAAAAANAGLARGMLDATDGVKLYWLWIGIPSILVLAGGAVIGWQLARTTQTPEKT
jgi:hypothetical protein